MENILVLGAGDFQLPLVQAAAKRFRVCLVAPTIPDFFMQYVHDSLCCDVRDYEQITDYAKRMNVCGVITDQTDVAVRTVAYVADKLGLPGIGFETGCLFTDKALMRNKMERLGIKTLPNKVVFSVEEACRYFEELNSEVIIKPRNTQGSRGVQHCRNLEELKEKFEGSMQWAMGNGVIVEKFAKGREFFVEGAVFNYQYHTLICGDTYYFDAGDAFAAKNRIVPTEANDELQERVCELNRKIITGFGLKQGITHSEFIMDGDTVYLIETAARGGGVFISSDLISLFTGFPVEDFLLDICTGSLKEMPEIKKGLCACGYLAFYVPKGEIVDIKGMEQVLQLPYLHRNQLDKLYIGKKFDSDNTDKTSRLAMIVSGKDRKELMERMEKIKSILNVSVQTEQGIAPLIWD